MENSGSEKVGMRMGVALMIGVVIGAAVTLLLTPRSGKELRADIQDGALHLRDQARAERDRMQVHMDDMSVRLEEVKQQVKSIGQHADVAVEDGDESSNVETV